MFALVTGVHTCALPILEQRLHVAGVGGLRRRLAILIAVGLHEDLRALVLQRPVPVRGAEEALDGGAGALGTQGGGQRNHRQGEGSGGREWDRMSSCRGAPYNKQTKP